MRAGKARYEDEDYLNFSPVVSDGAFRDVLLDYTDLKS